MSEGSKSSDEPATATKEKSMRIADPFTRLTGALVAASMLAGCYSHGGDATASDLPAVGERGNNVVQRINHKPNWISPAVQREAKRNGLLFVADNFNNVVDILAQVKPRRPIGTITNGIASPSGVGLDSSSDLYVTNVSGNSVTVYAPPYTEGPVKTYTSGLDGPVGVAIGADRSVYVSEYTDGVLVEYAPHSLTPSNIIALPGRPNGVALDARNNLFVAYEPYSGGGGVLEFAPASTIGTDLGIELGFAGGVTFDSRGNLLVTDEGAGAETVNVYPPGSKTPSQTIRDGFLNPVAIAFNARRAHLYVADAGTLDVESVKYPAGTTADTITGFGAPRGVALSPTFK
jgi:sugar lactone lactonase YvrE